MTSPTPHDWLHHLEDEADAAFLYRVLAEAEVDPERKKVFAALSSSPGSHLGRRFYASSCIVQRRRDQE